MCKKWLNTFPDLFVIHWHKQAHAAELLEKFIFTATGMLAPLEVAPYCWLLLVKDHFNDPPK